MTKNYQTKTPMTSAELRLALPETAHSTAPPTYSPGSAATASGQWPRLCVRTPPGAWPTPAPRRPSPSTPARGRVGDLIGVVSDAVGRHRADLSDDDRWAVAAALATTTRRCAGTIARSGPYARVPQLLEVAGRSRELTRAAATSPTQPDRLIGHDLLIPTSLLPRDASPARVAAESMTALATRFRAQAREPMSVRTLLSACYAGETVAHAGAAIIGSTRRARRPDAALAWRRLRAELARFTDRPRRNTEPSEPALRYALRVHDGLQHALDQLPPERADARHAPGADAEHLRRTVLLLPALAGGISDQLHRPTAWIAAGGSRPLHEGRVAEWLQHKPFLARGEDLYPALTALHRAAQATNRLTAALNSPGRQATDCSSLSRSRAGTTLSRH